MPPSPMRQEIEPKLTIAPSPAAIMPGATAWMAKNWCFRLTASRLSQLSEVSPCQSWRVSFAALLTSTFDRAERFRHLADRGLVGGNVGHVGDDELHCSAASCELGGERLALRRGDVVEADLRALPREGADDRLADAARAA